MNRSQLVHVVVFSLKPGIGRDDPRARAAAAITAGHPHAIPQIQSWVCGWDASGRSDAADFLVVSGFDSLGDYGAFQAHPDHERGKVAWRQVATWTVIDVNDPLDAQP
ncbi:Dabb family protein [Micropruina sp.]|uniref:Dabb family protein n=1 Tax=Micropruina sp. TaxID=2737536 RepID=UPI0039E47616